ncbi:MAG: response regulator transcription factor [Chitinophagaceae bacterium]
MPGSKHIEKRFLLVDDHTLIRSALASLLRQTYDNAVIEELADGTHIIEKLVISSYDLIVMDIQMPNTETLWLINYIHVNYPAVPVLVYSMTAENIYALRVLKAGAKGFVSKESEIEELKRAVELVLLGKRYISQNVAEIISLQSLKITDTPFTILSSRELQIATLLLSGNTVSDISKNLHLQNSTVGTLKSRVFKKLKVSNLLELKAISDIYNF